MDGQVCPQHRSTPVVVPDMRQPLGAVSAAAAATTPRIAIEAITPAVEHGRFPVKCVAGDVLEIEADIFGDGHDKIAAVVLWRPAQDPHWREALMQGIGNDRWRAVIPLNEIGRHYYRICAWRDGFATYRSELQKKRDAALDVGLEIQEGDSLI